MREVFVEWKNSNTGICLRKEMNDYWTDCECFWVSRWVFRLTKHQNNSKQTLSGEGMVELTLCCRWRVRKLMNMLVFFHFVSQMLTSCVKIKSIGLYSIQKSLWMFELAGLWLLSFPPRLSGCVWNLILSSGCCLGTDRLHFHTKLLIFNIFNELLCSLTKNPESRAAVE